MDSMVSLQAHHTAARRDTGFAAAVRGNVISKCANPECTAAFRYLHEGKLFQFEARLLDELTISMHAARQKDRPSREIERFWLCDSCSKTLTLVREPLTRRVVIAFLEGDISGAPADSSDGEGSVQQQPDAEAR